MAPKYTRPQAPITGNWPSGAAYQLQPKASVPDVTQLKWQEFFTDPKLQQIIETALRNNRDLRIAILNVEKARALYGIQWSELLPVINAQGEFIKQRSSSDFVLPGYSNISKQYSVDLSIASWEIDFFGRIRSLSKQALEEYLGTEEARRSAQITLLSEVARAYMIIAADQSSLHLARSTLVAQEGAYNLVARKFKAMLVNQADLYRAQTQVDTALGDLVRYTQQIAKDKNALNLLVGSEVPENLLPIGLESIKSPMDIFPGLSSDVLLRRPDIILAEHQLIGAYANIGAARAAFFPSISLTSTLGTASSQFTNLFSSGRGTWSFVPQVALPIFNPNTWFSYRVSESERKIALAQYEKAIQTAFREVADVLAVQGTVDQQIAVQQSMVESAQRIYQISSKRYANGIDSYLSVLDAQRSLYRAQLELIYMQLSKSVNKVKAYAVLGGGAWDGVEGRSRSGNRDFLQEEAITFLYAEKSSGAQK